MTSLHEHPLETLGAVGALLMRVLEGERVAPCYLFEGSDGESLRESALRFAACLIAGSPPGPPDERVFDLALRDAHPDLHHLTKDKPSVISVAALSAVLARAHTTPLEGARQVFVIEPAEAMEMAGIARYLKALEEPPPGTVFLLLSTRPERLPATVLSRCQRLRFPPLSDDVVARRLREEGHEQAERLARYASGSLGRAQRMLAADVVGVFDALCEGAEVQQADAARASESALSTLQRAATAQATKTSGVDMRRQYVRDLLVDVLHVTAIEARERAADRQSRLPAVIDAGAAITLLTRLERLSASVRSNVTPAAILLELYAALRDHGAIP